jgi:pimeloyl-ACP methyl ester carboxylesterase
MAPGALKPFTVTVSDDVLDDLRTRIRRTRWPDPAPGPAWSQGTDLAYLEELLGYWADGYDWRTAERELNRHRQFLADLGGGRVHLVHERARHGTGIPLVLTHGWPSCFVELLPLVPLLTDPAAHGLDGPAFDVVIPSLPGYGFSPRPARTGVNYRYVATLWRELMATLGYGRYGAHGGDFGSGVATVMALDEPDRVLGIHLTNLDFAPYTGPGSRPLSADEHAYVTRNRQWSDVERGYSAIQSTKPQTVGYGLTDSPAGLAAWLLEKWRSWTDSRGDLDARFSRDFLLTILTVYWVTGSITPSMRDYFDNRWTPVTIGPADYVRAPTGVAVFATEFVPEGVPPREWVERLYHVTRWTPMPSGGHFAPAEEPELVARDLMAFFGGLQPG